MGARYKTVLHIHKDRIIEEYDEKVYNAIVELIDNMLRDYQHTKEELVVMDTEVDSKHKGRGVQPQYSKEEAIKNIRTIYSKDIFDDIKQIALRYDVEWCRHYDMIWDMVMQIENHLTENKLVADAEDFYQYYLSGYTVSDDDSVTTIGENLISYPVMSDNFGKTSKNLYDMALKETQELIDTMMAEYSTYPMSDYNIERKLTRPKYLVKVIDAANFLEKKDVDSFVDMMKGIIGNIARDAWKDYRIENILRDSEEFNNIDDRKLILSSIFNTLRSIYLNTDTEVKGYNKDKYLVVVKHNFETGAVVAQYDVYATDDTREDIMRKLIDRLNDVAEVSIYQVEKRDRRLVKPIADYIHEV